MPIHEYVCNDCGHVSELLEGIGRNSDSLACKSCGGTQLSKLMSVPAKPALDISSAPKETSSCCGSRPSDQGCIPGSCCGSVRP